MFIFLLFQFLSLHGIVDFHLAPECMLSHLVLSSPLQLHKTLPTRLLCPWNSPDKNTGVGCHFTLCMLRILSINGLFSFLAITNKNMFVCYVCMLWIFLSKSLCGHMLSFSSDKTWEWNCWVILAQLVENLPAMQETWFWSLGRKEDPLETGMATHSSILVWRIPWTEEPGGLLSTGLQRVRHNWTTNTLFSRFIKGNTTQQ